MVQLKEYLLISTGSNTDSSPDFAKASFTARNNTRFLEKCLSYFRSTFFSSTLLYTVLDMPIFTVKTKFVS